jgi:hypothetical protein
MLSKEGLINARSIKTIVVQITLIAISSCTINDALEGHHIPGAIKGVFTGAISAQWPDGLFGSLRLRYVGEAPVLEDNSERSDCSNMVNLALGWSAERCSLKLHALNLLDSNDHDIDYFYASRLPDEPGIC